MSHIFSYIFLNWIVHRALTSLNFLPFLIVLVTEKMFFDLDFAKSYYEKADFLHFFNNSLLEVKTGALGVKSLPSSLVIENKIVLKAKHSSAA